MIEQPRVGKGKSKTVAVLLAVFLGLWTWLYTYKRNAWKFQVSLIVSLANILAGLVSETWMGVAPFVGLAISIWAIVDVVAKGQEWYRGY